MLGRGLVAAVCDSPRRERWRAPSARSYEYSIHTASGARDKKFPGEGASLCGNAEVFSSAAVTCTRERSENAWCVMGETFEDEVYEWRL